MRTKTKLYLWGTLKLVVFIVVATVVGKFFVRLGFPETNIVVIYILAVLLTARFTVGYAFGTTASIMSMLCYNYFFTTPYHTLAVNDPNYLITFTIMLITAFVTSALTTKEKLLTKEAKEKASESKILYTLSNQLSDAMNIESVVKIAARSVSELLQTDSGCIYFKKKNEYFCIWQIGDVETHRKIENAEDIYEKLINSKKEYYEDKENYNYVVSAHEKRLVTIQIPKSVELNILKQKESLLQSVLENVAMSMERIEVALERMKDRERMEQERYRANLLRAISHDLRTPLSGIIGTSEMLLHMTEKKDKRYHLIQGIYHDADWLRSLVENILSLTKLRDGKVHVYKEMEAIEEVVACAVEHIEKVSPDREIQVELPNDFQLVPMDAKLIQQVITNLLDNAIKHTTKKEKVELIIEYKNSQVEVTIRDEGEGLDLQDVPNIFQMFYTSKTRATDVKRGIGLGLTICETIIKAHGGAITGKNRTDRKGAEFIFCLPMKEEESDVERKNINC